jgi:ferredoxin
MLQALAEEHSDREIWWLHGARSSRDHSFAAEAKALLAALPNVARHVYYSRPGPTTSKGRDFDTRAVSRRRCSPSSTRPAMPRPTCAGRAVHGRDQRRPGGDGHRRLAHPHRAVRARAGSDAGHRAHPRGRPTTRRRTRRRPDDRVRPQRPRVPWSSDYASLLELAEACDVPVRWSCRTGVCHNCETTLIAGSVDYSPDPVEPPADGSALICCSQPRDDVVLDL